MTVAELLQQLVDLPAEFIVTPYQDYPAGLAIRRPDTGAIVAKIEVPYYNSQGDQHGT